MLNRKRDELLKQWEDREARLSKARAKEKAQEQRVTKRRRIDAGSETQEKDEDDEWLLADTGDDDADSGAAASGFSKDTRDLMEKLGMGPLKPVDDDEEAQDEIKVSSASFSSRVLLQTDSDADLLYLQNPLSIDTICLRAPPP